MLLTVRRRRLTYAVYTSPRLPPPLRQAGAKSRARRPRSSVHQVSSGGMSAPPGGRAARARASAVIGVTQPGGQPSQPIARLGAPAVRPSRPARRQLRCRLRARRAAPAASPKAKPPVPASRQVPSWPCAAALRPRLPAPGSSPAGAALAASRDRCDGAHSARCGSGSGSAVRGAEPPQGHVGPSRPRGHARTAVSKRLDRRFAVSPAPRSGPTP
jgi:hypothetical protein